MELVVPEEVHECRVVHQRGGLSCVGHELGQAQLHGGLKNFPQKLKKIFEYSHLGIHLATILVLGQMYSDLGTKIGYKFDSSNLVKMSLLIELENSSFSNFQNFVKF